MGSMLVRCRATRLALTLVTTIALAQRVGAVDTIAVADVTADAGGVEVRVAVSATTTMSLTGLSVDITFPDTLCAVISGESVVKAGRATVAPLEGGTRCGEGEGRVSIVLFDITGGTVLPAGSGPVAEWVFSIAADAAPQSVALALTVVQARNGPNTVELSPSSGNLTIRGAATPTATASPSATPTETRPPSPTTTATATPTRTDTATPVATSTATATTTPTRTSTVTPVATTTATPTRSNTATPVATSTATATPTGTDTATPVDTRTATATATPTSDVPSACVGDCDGSGSVMMNELMIGVNIALGTQPLTACPSFDFDASGDVAVYELLRAVKYALDGCPGVAALAPLAR